MSKVKLNEAAQYYLIMEIAKRAVKLWKQMEFKGTLQVRDIYLDVAVAHEKTPLRLDDLMGADDPNFMHDISGINRHLDRRTGQLKDCFLPRFTA